MRLLDVSLQNLRHRRGRMLFLLAGVILAVATVTALVSIDRAVQREVAATFARQGVRLVIAPQSEQLSLSYKGIPVAQEVSYQSTTLAQGQVRTALAAAAGRVALAAPRLVSTASVGGRQTLVIGMDFDAERKLKPWWRLEGTWPKKQGQVVVGSVLARDLGVAPGTIVTVAGRDFQVTGILMETGEVDDKLALMPLGEAQGLFDRKEQLSLVEVRLGGGLAADGSPEPWVEETRSNLQSNLPGASVTPLRDQNAARRETAARFSNFSLLISLVMVGIAALIIAVSMMGSVNERTQEIGVLRAIGYRSSHVLRIILTEAGLVSAIGGLVGYAAGVVLAAILGPWVMGAQVAWEPLLALAAVLGAVAVGLLASLYPALRAAHLDPTQALRFM